MLDPALQSGPVDVDDQADAVVQRHGQRLGAAHAAAAAGQRQGAGERAAEPLLRDRGERLVRALHDALGADVDPRAGRHLAVHGQPELLQAPEFRPGRPVADQVGVGDDHPRCPLMGSHHPDRATGLDEHRLVRRQRASGWRPWRRTPASPGPRDRCRRTRQDHRAVRRHRDRGCSSASAAGPRSPRSVP